MSGESHETPGSPLEARIGELLVAVYGHVPHGLQEELLRLAGRHRAGLEDEAPIRPFDQRAAYLITYADSLRRPGEVPLRTQARVLDETVGDLVTHVHLLPFFPWTSDDGFGVVDHQQVDPAVGTWADVHALGAQAELAFDFVANHTSASSPWFQGWLAGDDAYAGYYIERDPDCSLEAVVRPRTSPLFHDYRAPDGSVRSAWTTFGPDQVDVNVSTPAVLLHLTDVLLSYLGHGATTVRLDAIGYLVKRCATSCIHLPQTHAVVKLWRLLVDHVRPGARLLTETNVPHEDNIAYFGDGRDEAHMVYQFTLPPLVLHSFVTGSTTQLSRWARTVTPVSDTATWFNFLASHDGIGLRPTEGWLSDDERQALADRVIAHGGRVSMADRPDGTRSVYELNLGFLDALCSPDESADPQVFAAKAIAAHNILLSVVGVPAIYVHSLFGSRSDLEGMRSSGINRRVNRAVLDADTLLADVAVSGPRAAVLSGLKALLRARRTIPAFSPWSPQEVVDVDPRVFAVRRVGPDGSGVLSLTNVSPDRVLVSGLDPRVVSEFGPDPRPDPRAGTVVLEPYGIAWLHEGDVSVRGV